MGAAIEEQGEGPVSQVIQAGQQSDKTIRELRGILADVEAGINEILGDDGNDQDDDEEGEVEAVINDGNEEGDMVSQVVIPEVQGDDVNIADFHEGNAEDAMPEIHQLDEEGLTLLLEAGYTMEEIEGSRGIALPLDDMAAVEMDLSDGGHPDDGDDVDVFVDAEVEVQGDADDGEDAEVEVEVQGDAVAVDAEEVEVEVEVEGHDAVAVVGEPDEGHVVRVRRPSERILKMKLKKPVVGVGSSSTNPLTLE